jgi:hypothetical protein
VPTHAHILAIVDRLAPLEQRLEESAALWMDHQADDPQIAYMAADKMATFRLVVEARQLLERLAVLTQLADAEGDPIPRGRLRALLAGAPID